ncbi:MAG: PKD domain-containing protein [Planctomycetota bacterium]
MKSAALLLTVPLVFIALLLPACVEEKDAPTPPPKADFKANITYGPPPHMVTFEDLSESSAAIESWDWSFGDGGTSTQQMPTHTYQTAGVYPVTLTVTASSGSDTCIKPGYIIVTNPASIADFVANPVTGTAPLQVQFTDLSSVSGTITAWAWDFGDGNSSTQQDPLHTYNAVGTYTVSLTLTTDQGPLNKVRNGYISVTQSGPPPPPPPPPPPSGTGVDPSNGSGGSISAGTSGNTPLGAEIYIPTSYAPTTFASPVVWLFNEVLSDWRAIADAEKIIICDLHEYNNTTNIVNKLNETIPILQNQYNVDKARYYWAGWSAGGNLAVIIGSQNQNLIAGTMVFPGTGGNLALPHMQSWAGHKIRLYYACGDQDQNFAWTAVQYEANYWNQQFGYTTRFDKVVGAGHSLTESTYGVRATAWNWIKGYNLQN